MKKLIYNVLATIFDKKRNLPFSSESIVYPALVTPFALIALFLFWVLRIYNIKYQIFIVSAVATPLFFIVAKRLKLYLFNHIVKARKIAIEKYSLFKAFSFLLIFYFLCILPFLIAFLYYTGVVSQNVT